MQLAKRIADAAQFIARYGNPWSIVWARKFNPDGFTKVRDRASGLEVYCTVQSYRMFGEVWHDHDYEIPRVPIRAGDVVIDIGGNQGFYACYAAKKGGMVHTFEPFADSFGRLQRNVESNGLAKNVVAHQAAVGARDEQRELILTGQLGGGMNTIVSDFSKIGGYEETGRVTVKTVAVNSMLEKIPAPRIRIVKLDCEGAEMEILQHLSEANRERVDAFAIEYHVSYDLQDLLAILAGWKNHHLAFAESLYCQKNIIRAVHRRVYAELKE